MTDLVEEFFKRNLSESEAQALDGLLEHSPEEALRFGGKLEQEYLSLGLPAPQMPKSLMAPPAPAAVPLWTAALWAGGLAALAATAWWLWPKPHSALLSPAVPVLPRSALTAEPPRPPAAPRPSPPPPAIPEPVSGPSASGNRLDVVVDLEGPAPVVVRVLNGQDEAVRVLYDGNLQAGKWSLKWDGKLGDGTRAPAGDYRIEVVSGDYHMARTVSVAPAP